MSYKKFLIAVLSTYIFGIIWGLGIYHFAFKDFINQKSETMKSQQQQVVNNISTEIARLNVNTSVLKGQIIAITERYNDYGLRIREIEDKLSIFNHRERSND